MKRALADPLSQLHVISSLTDGLSYASRPPRRTALGVSNFCFCIVLNPCHLDTISIYRRSRSLQPPALTRLAAYNDNFGI